MAARHWPIPDAEAIALASPLDAQEEDTTPDRARELIAAAAWTVIAEPGDATAGALREFHGAVAALDMLFAGTAAADLVERTTITVKEITNALDRWQPRLDVTMIRQALTEGARWNQHLIIPCETLWPSQLDDLGTAAPAALWVRGNPDHLSRLTTSVSIVGARAATSYGTEVTTDFAQHMTREGIPVVSGGAFGIDAAAHRAVLAHDGLTVCVLAGGLDRFYPSAHTDLITQIERTGLVISETPTGTPPSRWRFLQRNRLIAALSSALVVTEAGKRSGALGAAMHALALGRPLAAVPGPVTSSTSNGCHVLIREAGAQLVASGDDLTSLVRSAK